MKNMQLKQVGTDMWRTQGSHAIVNMNFQTLSGLLLDLTSPIDILRLNTGINTKKVKLSALSKIPK